MCPRVWETLLLRVSDVSGVCPVACRDGAPVRPAGAPGARAPIEISERDWGGRLRASRRRPRAAADAGSCPPR
eukprot:2576451-Prymnesium_polylepis.1